MERMPPIVQFQQFRRFRLINAVLSQPPELPTVHRIATAVAEVGHLSLATAAQMLLVLWILSKVASGVAAFCVFAAIALIFDFVFHLTFFLAVLSVDVRRMELRDSLDRVKKPSLVIPERQYWLSALLQGRLPFSTRIAGSAISICFILALNMHFYESGSTLWSLLQSLMSMFHSRSLRQTTPFTPPINQARTPAAWLRIQDYRYAQEVLTFVKPNAHGIIVRVYDPLTVVLRNAERSGIPSRPSSSLFYVFWDLIRKHLYPFLLAIIFSVATVTLLMQYMLWNELPEEEPEATPTTDSILSLVTLPKAHRLDVIKLTACGKGHLVSLSIDRLVSISILDPRTHKYSLNVLFPAAMTPPLWPIVSIAVDDNGTWAALCSSDGNVVFWNISERRLSHLVRIDLQEQQPCAFSLVPIEKPESKRLVLVVVTPDGVVTEIDVLYPSKIHTFELSQEKLVSATISRSRVGTNIIGLSRSGRVRLATNHSGDWAVAALEKLDTRLAPGSKEGKIKSITVDPRLCILAAVRLRVVELVDIKTKTLIHTFPALLIKGHSLRILSSPRRECATCHSLAIHSISLVYTDFESQSCVMRTYALSDNYNDLMCLAPKMAGKTSSCKGFDSADESVHVVEFPGSWEATGMQSIIGIRMHPTLDDTHSSADSTTSGADVGYFASKDVTNRLHVGRRTPLIHSHYSDSTTPDCETEWETWTLSSSGEFNTLPLQGLVADKAQSIGEDDLFVASAGPIARLGSRSVAVGFGNRIKVLMVGKERFEQDLNEYQDLAHLGGGRRKRPLARKAI
jgi:WD40 repeat protein